MTEEDKFEVMVKTLVREANDGNKEVDSFEDAIMESGKGWAGFITHDYPDRVDFYQNHTLYTNPWETYAFYAEYYDGYQAPFPVCEWNGNIPELEALLQSCSINLYEKYVAECKEWLNDHKTMELD